MDGTEQGERLPAALAPDYFQVDELALEQRVAMSAAHAAQLRFFDLTQRPIGSWRELFAGDSALVIARIVSADVRRIERQFTLDAAAGLPTQRLAGHTLQLASWLDLWMKSLHGAEEPGARRLLERMEQLVELQLRDVLREALLRGGAPVSEGQTPSLQQRRLLRLDARWRASDAPPARATRSDQDVLRTCLYTFVTAVEQLQVLARAALPAVLQSQAHEPAASLLLAFLQLYQLTQAQINQFTRRHTRFYYERVLRMRPRAAVADTVHLVCCREPRFAREVLIAAGTVFPAGKDGAGHAVEFVAEDDLLVTDAQVAALHTLYFERDPLISPEREFGYVTRTKVTDIALRSDAAAPEWPLFGASAPRQAGGADRDARLGLAIAAPVLLLHEGLREIRVGFAVTCQERIDTGIAALVAQAAGEAATRSEALRRLFTRYLLLDPTLLPESATSEELLDSAGALAGRLAEPVAAAWCTPSGSNDAACYGRFIIELVVQSESATQFAQRLGRLFSRWLLGAEVELDRESLARLRHTAQRLLGERTARTVGSEDPLSLICEGATPDRALIFEVLFRDLFDVYLSTAEGWHLAQDAHISQASPEARGPQLLVHLQREDPAIVPCSAPIHGAEWPAGQPLLRIELKTAARMYPYSLLSQLLLSEIRLSVRVRGVRNLVLYNNLGRLDATKTLQPFGPLPTLSSYLSVGIPEAAAKHVTRLQLQLTWSGLPRTRGGFAEHYAGYEPVPETADFTAELAVLSDGLWQGQPAPVALFATESSGAIGGISMLDLDAGLLRKYYKPDNGPLEFSSSTRNGFIKVQLCGPHDAFGHAQYPLLLTRVVSENARLKRSQSVPRAPYTPALERVTADYEAEMTLALAQDSGAAQPGVRVLHLHPFGMEEIYRSKRAALPSALPGYAHAGNLLIGIAAERLQGPLTLLFQLCDAAAGELTLPRPKVRFAYLHDDRWHELPAASILCDTTEGLLTSGIVTLDLPSVIDADNGVMPAGRYWLRLSADHGFGSFAGLVSVRAQALRARRRVGSVVTHGVAAGVIKQPLRSIAGLQAVEQPAASFGWRAADDAAQLHTRTGERLQHKQRAVTPWDFERLVLERFNHIAKVKCFRAAAQSQARVLLVVIPTGAATQQDLVVGRRVNAIELKRIEDFLRARTAPCVAIEVRNAAYEQVQVRCTVKLTRGAPPGRSLRRINQCILEHLSPWHPQGYGARFDWIARGEDVAAWIRALECVDFVTSLSLLHIATDERGSYRLGDTARRHTEVNAVCVRPRSPYSILIPTREHLITTIASDGEGPPQVTGVANLAIGNTFIIDGNPT